MIIKNFNNAVTLTSQTREAILSFDSTSESGYVVPWYDVSTSGVSLFFVNGSNLGLTQSTPERLSVMISPTIPAVFHVFTKSPNDFSLNMKFKRYSDEALTSLVETIDVSVYNRPFIADSNEFNMYPNGRTIVDNESSYLVLRTNPKFSGNVKLMVDSSDNLYIDTFKVSDTLSNKKYRKQQVSANSTFSSDIRNVFENIPNGEMYKLDFGNVLDVALPKTEIQKQYNTTYSYGARLLEDDLYPEDYSMLAPLWINAQLPDFFAIFRIDGAFNVETYEGTDLSGLAKKYVAESDLIKSWSMLPTNNLGKYLRTHVKEMNAVQSPVFLPLSEYDHNVWNGISVKKGLICSSQETSYQFEKAVENFTDTNAFISLGFERNNILCPNLINLEFAFNDDSASMYSMHRYFGLYLSENVMYKVSYYKTSKDAQTFSILPIDGKDFTGFMTKGSDPMTSVFDEDGNIAAAYANRIFVINERNKLHRIKNLNQLNDISYVNDYCNREGGNIFSTPVVKSEAEQFITVDILDRLEQGEHMRVIDVDENIVWEVYGIERDIEKGESYFYASASSYTGYPTVYRNAFSSKGTKEEQAAAIKSAFNSFNNFDVSTGFTATVTNGGSFSIVADVSSGKRFRFQRLTSTPNATEIANSNESSVSLFGRQDLPLTYQVVTFDSSFGPIDFEYHGNRRSLTAEFIRKDDPIYVMLNDVRDDFQPYMYYRNLDGWNELVGTFDVSVNGVNTSLQYVKDPTRINDKYMITVGRDAELVNGAINVYSLESVNISIMGINNVKDFDFNVYDSVNLSNAKSEYTYSRENDRDSYFKYVPKGDTSYITTRGSYVISEGKGDITIGSTTIAYSAPFGFNTFDSSAKIYSKANTAITYSVLDGSVSFAGLSSSFSEESIDDYYVSDSLLKYGLTTPYVTKWVMQGLDCRNNEMRLSLFSKDSSAFTSDVSSNFIPTLESSVFSNEISFPAFKYLSLGGNSWKDYVYFDVNDVIQIDASTRTTIKRAILDNPYVDVFSKIMLSSVGTDSTKNRTSIMSFNKYKNSVDTVYSGLKISLSRNSNILELASVENYNKFKFGFISTSSRNYENNKPIEVFINENTGTILVVWYQGTDVLNHHFRNSSTFAGKSIMNAVSGNKNFNYFYGANDPSLYSFVKSQFYVRTDALGIDAVGINSSSNNFDYGQASPLLQLSHNTAYNIGSVFNAYTRDNSVNNNVYEPYTSTYNNFTGRFQYAYISNTTTSGINVINHASIYRTNKNYYDGEACDVKLLDKLIRNGEVHFYIIRKDTVYDNKVFGNDSFSLTLNAPKSFRNKIMTHNGGYFPKFNNVLNFSNNESQLIIDNAKKDFVAGNTNIISHDNIRQMWYNKVVQEVTETNVNEKNAIDVKNDFNVFGSLWDSAYYTMYNAAADEGEKNGEKNGYESPFEMPSFFGSKLVRLPRTITLSAWDSLNSAISYSVDTVTIRFNLSLTLQRMFKNESAFISNWANLPGGAKFIDQYIGNTIQNYYSINMNSIGVKLYYAKSESLGVSASSTGMSELTAQNFTSELVYENQEYFYVINIKSSYDNITYHADITISQK